jgi:hypothetical protein
MRRRRSTTFALLGALAMLAVLVGAALLLRTPTGVAQEQQPLLTYPEYPPTPTIGPNPTPAPGLASGVEVAREDFSAPAAFDAWTVVNLEFVLPEGRAVWEVADGRLAQAYTAAVRNPSTLETAALHPADWADGAVRASFYDLHNGVAGLVARYSDAVGDGTTASYYRYRVIKNSYSATPKQVLEKVVDGAAVSLVEIARPGFDERTWHIVELTVIGGHLTVTLDGTVVAEATDPQPLGAGRAGVYSRALGGILFDDVVISAP